MKNINIIKHVQFAVLAATLLFQTSTTRADDHRDATITFTKHVTAFLPPGGEAFATVAGTDGGDIGEGTMTGEALSPIDVLADGSISFEADYHFVGKKHSLTVHFRTIQAPDASGVIIGLVTDGWLKGNAVVGHYTARSCDEGVNFTCFDGVFTVQKGTKNKD
jgi:hypothetical protein